MLNPDDLERLGLLAAALRSQANELIDAIERVKSAMGRPLGDRHNPDLDDIFGAPPPLPPPPVLDGTDSDTIDIGEILGKSG